MTDPLTPEQLDLAIKAVCPHCRAGVPVRQRDDTKEYVHDRSTQVSSGGSGFSHTLCWANGLRNSDLNPENVKP